MLIVSWLFIDVFPQSEEIIQWPGKTLHVVMANIFVLYIVLKTIDFSELKMK